MAAKLGVFAKPVFEIAGDIENADMAKLSKVMHAGHDRVGAQANAMASRPPAKQCDRLLGNQTQRSYLSSVC